MQASIKKQFHGLFNMRASVLTILEIVIEAVSKQNFNAVGDEYVDVNGRYGLDYWEYHVIGELLILYMVHIGDITLYLENIDEQQDKRFEKNWLNLATYLQHDFQHVV